MKTTKHLSALHSEGKEMTLAAKKNEQAPCFPAALTSDLYSIPQKAQLLNTEMRDSSSLAKLFGQLGNVSSLWLIGVALRSPTPFPVAVNRFKEAINYYMSYMHMFMSN